MKILAIDYGTVRIGLAISFGKIAEPLKIISNDEKSLKEIERIIIENRVEKIVVGISENQMEINSKNFAKNLKLIFAGEIELTDETLSSHEVNTYLKDRKLKDRQRHIDHFAAAVILQNYLDSQPKS